MHVGYLKGDLNRTGTPWEEKGTGEACVDAFLEFARHHFTGNPPQNQRDAQKAMLQLLEGGGLFGFNEPEPTFSSAR